MQCSRRTAFGAAVMAVMGGCSTAEEDDPAPYCAATHLESDFTAAPCGEPAWQGDLTITHPGELERLRGHRSIRGTLRIEQSELTSLSGLEALTCIDGDLVLRDNPALRDLSGLSGLRHVGGDLTVGDHASGNPQLVALNGLDQLETVEGHVWIQGNPALTSLEPLARLRFVGDFLGVVDNPSLHQLGLAGLDHLGVFLNVAANPALPTCEVVALRDRLAGACRNTCIRGNQLDECAAETRPRDCWYDGAEASP